MGAIEEFMARGVRFELEAGDTVRAIGRLTDPLRADIKAQKASIIRELQWQEIERLLAIVGPAYRTPQVEIVEMRQLARENMDDALTCYRKLARQINAGV